MAVFIGGKSPVFIPSSGGGSHMSTRETCRLSEPYPGYCGWRPKKTEHLCLVKPEKDMCRLQLTSSGYIPTDYSMFFVFAAVAVIIPLAAGALEWALADLGETTP